MMQPYNKEHLPLIIIMLLCTALIIATNLMFSRQTAKEVPNQIKENQYTEIGGKDNFMIMKELQKEEILNYINKLKQENPEIIYKMRQNALAKNSEAIRALSWDAVQELKNGAYIKGGSGATITIMEFSDMECPYCSEYHNSDVVGQILSKYKDVNYAFKNFPLPNHKNSGDLALYGKCIEKLSSGEKYLDFVDYIFQSPTNLSGPLLAEKIKGVLPKFSVSESDFDACVNNKENLNLVKKEFEQGLKLEINSTPSSVIINNKTGEFTTLSGVTNEEKLSEVIDSYLKVE